MNSFSRHMGERGNLVLAYPTGQIKAAVIATEIRTTHYPGSGRLLEPPVRLSRHVITLVVVGDIEEFRPPAPKIDYTVRESYTLEPRPWWAFWRKRTRRVDPGGRDRPQLVYGFETPPRPPGIDMVSKSIW